MSKKNYVLLVKPGSKLHGELHGKPEGFEIGGGKLIHSGPEPKKGLNTQAFRVQLSTDQLQQLQQQYPQEILEYFDVETLPSVPHYTSEITGEARGLGNIPTPSKIPNLDQLLTAVDYSTFPPGDGKAVDLELMAEIFANIPDSLFQIYIVDSGIDFSLVRSLYPQLAVTGDGPVAGEMHGTQVLLTMLQHIPQQFHKYFTFHSINIMNYGSSGTFQAAITGLKKLKSLVKANKDKINIANHSWNSGFSADIEELITAISSEGCLSLAAGGNAGGPGCNTSPCANKNGLKIGALDLINNPMPMADFDPNSVSWFSAGPSLVDGILVSCIDFFTPTNTATALGLFDGTSAATPVATAIAAITAAVGFDTINLNKGTKNLPSVNDVISGLNARILNTPYLGQVPGNNLTAQCFNLSPVGLGVNDTNGINQLFMPYEVTPQNPVYEFGGLLAGGDYNNWVAAILEDGAGQFNLIPMGAIVGDTFNLCVASHALPGTGAAVPVGLWQGGFKTLEYFTSNTYDQTCAVSEVSAFMFEINRANLSVVVKQFNFSQNETDLSLGYQSSIDEIGSFNISDLQADLIFNNFNNNSMITLSVNQNANTTYNITLGVQEEINTVIQEIANIENVELTVPLVHLSVSNTDATTIAFQAYAVENENLEFSGNVTAPNPPTTAPTVSSLNEGSLAPGNCYYASLAKLSADQTLNLNIGTYTATITNKQITLYDQNSKLIGSAIFPAKLQKLQNTLLKISNENKQLSIAISPYTKPLRPMQLISIPNITSAVNISYADGQSEYINYLDIAACDTNNAKKPKKDKKKHGRALEQQASQAAFLMSGASSMLGSLQSLAALSDKKDAETNEFAWQILSGVAAAATLGIAYIAYSKYTGAKPKDNITFLGLSASQAKELEQSDLEIEGDKSSAVNKSLKTQKKSGQS